MERLMSDWICIVFFVGTLFSWLQGTTVTD